MTLDSFKLDGRAAVVSGRCGRLDPDRGGPASSWVTSRVIDVGGGADTPPMRSPVPRL